MSSGRAVAGAPAVTRVREWLPVGFRLVVAVALLPAGVLKFVDYSGQAAAFATYGVPEPGVTVVLVGALEVGAAVAVAFGVASRAAALAVVPVMLAAMWLYAVVPSNTVVLGGCLGVAALGPGKYALDAPEIDLLDRVR